MRYLVGSTGFVGSNVLAAGGFDGAFHSTNVRQAFGARPELLVYAGLRAEKFLANSAPARDLAAVETAFDNIRKIAPKRLALISTVDVYPSPVEVDEATPIDASALAPYGRNRLLLEEMARSLDMPVTVFRLPGLYGPGLKKNFVYDLIHEIPSALTKEKLLALSARAPALEEYYAPPDEGGFCRCRALDALERRALLQTFRALDFSALSFTDSRAVFQFYPLSRLWADMERALGLDLPLLNLAVEPIGAAELYRAVKGSAFDNSLARTPPRYDFRSRHAALFGGSGGYLLDKARLLPALADFVRGEAARLC